MARKMRPRRVVLHDLKTVRTFLAWVSNKWNVTGHVWEAGIEGSRERQFNEYPENQPEAWRKLQSELNLAIKVLTELREYAEEQETLATNR